MTDEATAVPAAGTLAAPSGSELQIWWARVPVGRVPEPTRQALAADLDDVTGARLARFRRPEDADRGLAAHALLRRLLAGVTGTAPAAVRLRTRCAGCGRTDHGKPYLDTGSPVPPVELNLSHSGEVVVVALAAPGVAVGVDVEQRRSMDWTSLRRSVFADLEWELTERAADPVRLRTDHWARKEAAAKAAGRGLSLPFREVVIAAGDEPGVWTTRLPAGGGSAAGRDLDIGPDVAAALAVHFPGGRPGPIAPPAIQRADLGT